jgi:anti-anti-sigma factor
LLEVNIQREGDVAVVLLAGELCLATSAVLEKRLDEVLQADIGELIIDLRELSFLDSTAIRLLLTLEERAAVEGWRFAIVTGSGTPRRTLDLAGMQRHPRRISADDAGLGSLA